MIRALRAPAAVAGLLLLAGCAGVPTALQDAPAESPAVTAVREQPEAHVGERVRWGGTVAEVINRRSDTVLAIVARPLRDNGRPYADAASPGRFLARIAGFLDPAVYREGRSVTVIGTVAGSEVREIGDYPYRYPVVQVDSHYLWEPLPPPQPARCLHSPFWYDPFWHPWYGPSPWPYYHCY